MKDKSDEIFIISQDQLQTLPYRSMRSGFLGKSLEDALQTLLQKYPEVIPGAQISPALDSPPQFLLLRREMPIGNWSLDHLYVDQYGILTLIETKLAENPEARREVIGQIIEYAANSTTAWASGKLRQYATEFWNNQGKLLEDVIIETFGDIDIENLWELIEENLKHNRIRLIITADDIRPEVRRMIEFLNREMQNTEVLGLELRPYGDDVESLVLVPRVIGQTQSNVDRRFSSSGIVLWTFERLSKHFRESYDDETLVLLKILEWAQEKGCLVESRAQRPTFGLCSKIRERIISVTSTGELYLFFEEYKYQNKSEDRDALLSEFKRIKLFPQDLDPIQVRSGRNTMRKVWELTSDELKKLFDILDSYCA
jgi:hypothetical protein